MRLGAHVFSDTRDPVELAKIHRSMGYRAAYCPSYLNVEDIELIHAFRKAFADEDVIFAEVGAWCNPLDQRPEIAAKNINNIMEKLALADELGALCCVNIIGSYDTEFWYAPHEKNFSDEAFEESVVIARKIVDAVKPKRAKFTFEIMPYTFLDNAENYLKFIKAVDRSEVGVHLDPINLLNSPRTYFDHVRIMEESFKLLGPHIVSCHAKDISIRLDLPNTHLDEVRPGQGIIDYRVFLKCAASLTQDVPIMLEHLADQKEYSLAADHIFKIANEMNLKI